MNVHLILRFLAFSLLHFFCFATVLHAQEQAYRHISVEDGLPSSFVTALLQDSKAFLWIATDQGVVRFDGNEMELFGIKNGLSDNHVVGIYEDATQRIWCYSLSGLSYYEKGKMQRYLYNDKIVEALKDDQIRSIYVDSKSNVWVDSDHNAFRVDVSGMLHNAFSGALNDGVLEIKNITDDFQVSRRKARVFDRVIWNTQTDTLRYHLKNQPVNIGNEGALHISALKNGSLLVNGGSHWLNLHKDQTKDQLLTNEEMTSGAYQFDDEHLWVGFKDIGVYKNLKKQPEQFLEGKSVSAVLMDHEKAYWFATLGDGLYYMPSENFLHYDAEKYFGKGKITGITNTETDLWLGMENGGLYRINEKEWEKWLQLEEIRCLASDTNDHVWIAAYYSTFELNNKGKLLNEYFISPSCFAIGQNNSVFYVKENKIYHRNGNEVRIDTIPNANFRRVSTFWENEKELWLGTQKALWHWDYQSKTLENWTEKQALLKSRINGIAQLSDGKMCFATYGAGLLLYDGNAWEHYTEKDGLASDFCNGLYVKDSQIWLPTTAGLSKLDFLENDQKKPRISNYSINNGLGFNDPKDLRIIEDQLWVINNRGLTVGNIKEMESNQVKPPVHIKSVRVNGAAMPFYDQLKLDHDQNQLVFRFAGLSYKSAGKLKYEFRLKNADAAWTRTETNEVQYSGLSHGDYEFQVRAMNADGYWSETPVSIRFTIACPIWKTWWFRALFVLLIGILVFYLFKRRLNILEEKNQLTQQSLASEQKALRTQITPHFMFNALNSIQWLIANNDKFSAIESTARFARLMRNVLENSMDSEVSLAKETETLDMYLKLEGLRFKGKFSYKLEADPEVDATHERVPPMMIQPFIENAIWHGIMKKVPQEGHVHINFYYEEDYLVVKVEDDGVGRQYAQQMESENQGERKSFGISIIEERLKILNQQHHKQMRIEIKDLFDDDGKAKGTRVLIYLDRKFKN